MRRRLHWICIQMMRPICDWLIHKRLALAYDGLLIKLNDLELSWAYKYESADTYKLAKEKKLWSEAMLKCLQKYKGMTKDGCNDCVARPVCER